MESSTIADNFFQLVRYSLNDEESAPRIDAEEWLSIFEQAKKQAILGVVFEAVQRLGKNANIPRELKMKWFYLVEKIKNRNMLLNVRSVELQEMFVKDGFECSILKGQGNALMYPNPYARTSGDIDLQVRGGRDSVTRYVKQRFPHTKTAYQHVDYPIFQKVPVEIHYLPIYMNNPLYNRRLQKWVLEKGSCLYGNEINLPEGVGRINVPNWEFNVVFQLAHLLHHLLDEGIGLRHMIDYYYLLKSDQRKDSLQAIQKELNRLGLRKFGGAVMFIMHEVLGLEDKFLILPVDKKRGETLLKEILQGGNFGHSSGLNQHSLLEKHMLKYWRALHFIREYPEEALCEPIFRTWHYFWRLKNS